MLLECELMLLKCELMLLKCELMLLKCELMLLKCELMLLKSQINTNTNKNRFLFPTKCLEWVLKYSYIVSIIFE